MERTLEIPTARQSQTADSIGRAPAYDWDADGRHGAFVTIDGALAERQGAAAVRQWFALMLRQSPGAIPIYRISGTTQPGVDRSIMHRDLPEGFVQAEIERAVRETAAFCPAVRMVDDFRFTRLQNGLQVGFRAYLHTDETVEVIDFVTGE